MEAEKPFTSIDRAAMLLGLPKPWLRAEVEANRIPHLKCGRTIALNIPAVKQALVDRAANEPRKVADNG